MGENAAMVEPSEWMKMVTANPSHSDWFVKRFRDMAAAGDDLSGEARFVDAMAPRGARILDAGCGTGRVGAVLAAAGHDVVGVDVDPVLVAAAEEDFPGPQWIVGDLAQLDLPGPPFDVIVAAGNVMPFLAASTRTEVLRRLRRHVAEDGRVVLGFGAGRGYEFDEFLADARSAAFTPDLLLSGWDVRPLRDDSDFLVAILSPA
jgi:SAM-dependent methyltransferase